MIRWVHPNPKPTLDLNQFSLFCTDERMVFGVPILYNGTPLPHPQNCPFSWFRGPTQVLNPNGISIGSAVFAGLNSVTDRQTTLLGR